MARHPLLGNLEDDVEEAEVVEVLKKEKPAVFVGRSWDEERGAPIPEAPDPPPVMVNGVPMDALDNEEPSTRELLRKVAGKLLRGIAKKLDPDG